MLRGRGVSAASGAGARLPRTLPRRRAAANFTARSLATRRPFRGAPGRAAPPYPSTLEPALMAFGPSRRPRTASAVPALRLLRAALGCALVLGAAARPAPAQVPSSPPPRDTIPPTTPATVPVRAGADTVALARRDTVAADTVRGVTPKGAFLRSLVLPGWGQSAVGSPGRGAIYFALETGSLWMVYKSHRKLHYARRNQAYLREVGELEEDRQSALVNVREEQLEDWITLSGFFLLFNAADAFVSAHLVDFDERIGVVPGQRGGASVQLSVPLGRRP